MQYKKGDKFTIEITDVMTGEDGKTVYRMNDFSSLVFDDKGLDRLEKKVVEPEKKSPFERAIGEHYWNIGGNGAVNQEYDNETEYEDEALKVANYCTDRSMMKQRALHETLNRLLWRYSEEHGGDPEWDGEAYHWYIYCPSTGGLLYTNVWSAKIPGIVYFGSKQIAESAINDIIKPFLADHPEFVW